MKNCLEQVKTTILFRAFIKPGHEDNFLTSWQQMAENMQKSGFEIHYAFMETGSGMKFDFSDMKMSGTEDERVFTWLYSYVRDIADAESKLHQDLESVLNEHILQMDSRPVKQEIMNPANEESFKKMIVMRRYNIKNDWIEFMDIWRRIVPVREKYGFPCLFAVSDEEEKVFTWAFTYDGDNFETFLKEGQAGYYSDPQRVELETVNNYLSKIRLTPSRQIRINQ